MGYHFSLFFKFRESCLQKDMPKSGVVLMFINLTIIPFCISHFRKIFEEHFFTFPLKNNFSFFRTEILLHFGVPDNQIALHFGLPDKQIPLHLDVPDNCSLFSSGGVRSSRSLAKVSTPQLRNTGAPSTNWWALIYFTLYTVNCTLYTFSTQIFNTIFCTICQHFFKPIFTQNLL